MSTPQSTTSQLRAQWKNPTDVLSLLLLIGGDIVQKALAQATIGHMPHVCFSFGWVAYSYTTLVGILGDGRLLPPPDYSVKVFNLGSGYMRENKNWVIGRLLRDNQFFMNMERGLKGASIRISIYTAEAPVKTSLFTYRTERFWLLCTLAQVIISAIPLILDREWGVFLVTVCGVLAAVIAGILPQWSVEKLPLNRSCGRYWALTSGNGSREIMVIYSTGAALDLEEIAAGESPRSDRVWEASKLFSGEETGRRYRRQAYMRGGLPIGLWLTGITCFVQVIFWVALLVSVAGLRSHSWYLVGVGSLGMLQNAIVAAIARRPDRRGIPLTLVDTIVTDKTMDGLMDLECTIHGAGKPLLHEFFPGSLREDEALWWEGERDIYDNQRVADSEREPPRSRLEHKSMVPDIRLNKMLQLGRRTSSGEISAFSAEVGRASSCPPLGARNSERATVSSGKRWEQVGSESENDIPVQDDSYVRSSDWV